MAVRPTLSFETATVPPVRRLDLRWDLPGILLRAALLMGAATALIAAALAFRLAAQFVAWTSLPTPASWLYAIGGAFASPFGRYETARPVEPGTGIEFAGLVALEAYLVAGLVLSLGLFRLRSLARRRFPAVHDIRVDYGAVFAATAGAAAIAGEALRYGSRAVVRRRDVDEVEAAISPRLSFETPPGQPAASRRRAGRRGHRAAPYTRA